MKKTMIAVAVVVLMMGLAGSAFAANSLQKGKLALSVGFTDLSAFPDGMENTIIGKLFLADDMAAVLGFGLTMASGDLGTPDGTDFSFVIGARKYFKKDDFAPYAEGLFVYFSDENSNPPQPPAGGGGLEIETIGVLVNLGGEYFLHKQFSVEGSAGVGLMKSEYKPTGPGAGPSADTTMLGTSSLGVRANFYF